jgi:predicted enzyme related to lactoylglutathione lyase
MGCTAFDLALAGCGVRFLVPPGRGEVNPLTTAITDLLDKGAGILGWTWACQSVYRSRDLIEARSSVGFVVGQAGRKTLVVPRKLSPGATTLLEPLVHEEVPAHPNHVTGLDHIVLTVTNVEAAADTYERAFGLKARRVEMNGRRYAFLKVGEVASSVLEIVGPAEIPSGPLSGGGWGVAFRTEDLDATMRYMRDSRVEVGEPHKAVQGGRIASLPVSVGGIQIALLGD